MTTELVPLPESDHPAVPRQPIVGAWLAGRKPDTVRAYAGDLLHFARWSGAPSPAEALDSLLSLTQGDAHGIVLAYRHAMIERGDSSASINRRLAALRSVVTLAYATGRSLFTLHITNVKHERRRDVRGPDESERKRIFRVMRDGKEPVDKRDAAIVALLFGLSLRRNEVVSLDMSDINLRRGTVHPLRKGKRERVGLKIPPHVNAYLSVWLALRGAEAGPVFTRLDRPGSLDRLTGEGLARAVARLGSRAGFARKLTPHMFRHAFVTSARGRRLTDREIISATGHASAKTLELYDDARERDAGVAADAVASELPPPRAD